MPDSSASKPSSDPFKPTLKETKSFGENVYSTPSPSRPAFAATACPSACAAAAENPRIPRASDRASKKRLMGRSSLSIIRASIRSVADGALPPRAIRSHSVEARRPANDGRRRSMHEEPIERQYDLDEDQHHDVPLDA